MKISALMGVIFREFYSWVRQKILIWGSMMWKGREMSQGIVPPSETILPCAKNKNTQQPVSRDRGVLGARTPSPKESFSHELTPFVTVLINLLVHSTVICVLAVGPALCEAL